MPDSITPQEVLARTKDSARYSRQYICGST